MTPMSAVCRNSPLPLCHISPTLSAISRPKKKPEYNRLRHVASWSENMRNAMLRASLHIRTRLLELTPAGEIAAAWLTVCVPNVPPSVLPGVSLRTREHQLRML